jgi:DNA ligase (NAD+)
MPHTLHCPHPHPLIPYTLQVVVTGTWESGGREYATQLVESLGAVVQSGGVNRNTHLLVYGGKPGPNKLAKAEQLGVAVMSETEFLDKYVK